MNRVLVVEDEQHIAEGLRFNLEAEGYQVQVVQTGEAALELLQAESPAFDVVILDVMLPGKDGFAVMSDMRQAGQFIPTLMLTARGHPEDVLKGFAAGADDYLPKPFELAILIARIRGLLRRREWLRASVNHVAVSAEPSDKYTFGDKSVNFELLRAPRPGGGVPADPDGSERPAILNPARGQAGIAQGNAGGGLGAARRHRHAGDRQFHRAPAPLCRGRSDETAARSDCARRRLSLRGVAAAGVSFHPLIGQS